MIYIKNCLNTNAVLKLTISLCYRLFLLHIHLFIKVKEPEKAKKLLKKVVDYNASKKERNGIILLFAMLLPIWLLGISIDVDGWLQRMGMDLASFLILVSAFTMSYLVMGLEKVAEWIENRFTKIKISKMKPKISFTVIVIGLLIVPLVIPNIAMGRTLQPILSPEEVHDLQEMQGKLPVDDCLIAY